MSSFMPSSIVTVSVYLDIDLDVVGYLEFAVVRNRRTSLNGGIVANI